MQDGLSIPKPVTNYPLLPVGVCFLANWWMVGFPSGKCSFGSNLFHLFWSNYQPRCLWLVDYSDPASLAVGPDRHTAISHFTIWTPPPFPGWALLLWWGPMWSPGCHGCQKGFSSSPSVSLESRLDGNTDTELNHRDVIPAECTDIINPRYCIHRATAKRI